MLARLRDYRCHSNTKTIEKALTGNYRAEHLFALEQALALYDVYHEKVSACDIRIEAVLKELSIGRGHKCDALPSSRRRTDQVNGLAFDARSALFALLGKDITRVDVFGPYLALKLVAECGDDLLAWPSAKHFTSWLGLAPNNKISGGRVLTSRTRRTGSRAAALLRLAAVTVGRTDTALGAFYRRLSARIGKAKAGGSCSFVLQRRASRNGICRPGYVFCDTRYRSGWSKICIGAPRHSALFFSQLRRRPAVVLPFLRKTSLALLAPCVDRNGSLLHSTRKGAAVPILVARNPVKKPGPWAVAHLRVVTPSGDPV